MPMGMIDPYLSGINLGDGIEIILFYFIL